MLFTSRPIFRAKSPCRRRCPFALVLIVVGAFSSVSLCGSRPGKPESRLNADLLNESLSLGTLFMLNHQKPEGNFTYEYDFVSGNHTPQDNMVRQAGALWGLSLIHHAAPSDRTRAATDRGLSFFRKHSVVTRDGRRYIAYPGAPIGRTGAVALVTLALIERLRTQTEPEPRARYELELEQYIGFLLSQRLDGGQFHGTYLLHDGTGFGVPSPYADGEVLLALTKAAKYAGFGSLREIALESARSMHGQHVEQALADDPDSDVTKGFFQWGLMTFHELFTAGWPGTERYSDRGIDLAYWMIDVHRTLERTRNTAYAHEGLIVAWELARLTRRTDAMEKIGDAVDRGLYKLTTWQVGGSVENPFLQRHPDADGMAAGGVLNGKNDPRLRVDVTQHQTHAVILARRYLYPNAGVTLADED